MVATIREEGQTVQRCADGHLMTLVRRPKGLRAVCLTCLGKAMNAATERAASLTVNDLMLGIESGELPRLRDRDAAGLSALMDVAKDMHGAATVAEFRKVIRSIADANDRKVKEVMNAPAASLPELIERLRVPA